MILRFSATSRRFVAVALLVAAGAVAFFVMQFRSEERTPERARPFLIGALNASWGPTPQVAGLRDGLLAMGYREGDQFVIGVRFARGDLAVLPLAARQLVQDGVDVIFADHDAAAKAAHEATTEIPIVFAAVGDPLSLGLIDSFARPGGNVTGVTDLHLELSSKRLQVFREIIPDLHRVLFPYYAEDQYAGVEIRQLRDAAMRLGIALVERPLRTQEEAQSSLAAVRHRDFDGILAPPCCALNIPGFVLEANAHRGIPAMFEGAYWAERGALVSYGQDFYTSGQMAARLVDKILKGGKPAEIPIEVNEKLEYVINLKVAKTLQLTIRPEILYRADRIIR